MTDDFAGETPAPEQKKSGKAKVTLATTGNVSHFHLPPVEDGDEHVTIVADGTEVDAGTAARAYEAARLAGVQLIEMDEES